MRPLSWTNARADDPVADLGPPVDLYLAKSTEAKRNNCDYPNSKGNGNC